VRAVQSGVTLRGVWLSLAPGVEQSANLWVVRLEVVGFSTGVMDTISSLIQRIGRSSLRGADFSNTSFDDK
jgi:hypothetical protein